MLVTVLLGMSLLRRLSNLDDRSLVVGKLSQNFECLIMGCLILLLGMST